MSKSIWRIAGASVDGTSHATRGDACQDHHQFSVLTVKDDEVMIAAVSDGAGSASKGLEGARTVCDSFIGSVAGYLSGGGRIEQLNEEFTELWIAEARSRISTAADASESDPRDYSCTFLGVVLSAKDAAFFQIGDGAIVYSTAETPDSFLFPIVPAESMYVNTTDFITDAAAEQKIQSRYLAEPVGNVAVFTDGIQALAIDYSGGGEGKPHMPFWTPMFAPFKRTVDAADLTAKLEVFLNSETVNRRTDDDKTLVLISNETAAAGPVEKNASAY